MEYHRKIFISNKRDKMRKIIILMLILLCMPFISAIEVKDITLDMKIYYEAARAFKIKIYGYDDEMDHTFTWTVDEIGDTQRWEATNVEIKVGDKLQKIDISFKVWNEGERSAKIRVYGYDKDEEKSISWTSGEDGTIINWKPLINYEFETTTEENVENVKIWKNLTLEFAKSRKDMENITRQCYEIIRLNNESHLIAREYADVYAALGKQNVKLELCKNESTTLSLYKTKYDECNIDKNICISERSTCYTERDSLKKQGGSNWFVFIGIGCVVGYYFGKRKETKPSEEERMGEGIPGI